MLPSSSTRCASIRTIPRDPFNDRFVLSKGHAAPLFYAVWAEVGRLRHDDLLFACFFTRAADQIRLAGISRSNVKFCGSHAGVSIGEDGASQMGLYILTVGGLGVHRLAVREIPHSGPAAILLERSGIGRLALARRIREILADHRAWPRDLRHLPALALVGIGLAGLKGPGGPPMGIFGEIQKFIEDHRPCGEVTGRAQPPTVKGYRVWMVCTCGDTYDRWVTPEAARHDLIYSNLLVLPN